MVILLDLDCLLGEGDAAAIAHKDLTRLDTPTTSSISSGATLQISMIQYQRSVHL